MTNEKTKTPVTEISEAGLISSNNQVQLNEPEPQAVAPAMAKDPMAMLYHAVTNGSDVEILDKLMGLQERYEANQVAREERDAKKAYNLAIANAKAQIKPITKNRTVDYENNDRRSRTTYQHEDLAGIAEQIDPILAQFGLSYRYRTEQVENGLIVVTCILSHRDGHFEENSLKGNRDDSGKKNNYQQLGSAITYLQRYTLKSALGLSAAQDDDASKIPADEDEKDQITEEQFFELRDRMELVGVKEDSILKDQGIDILADMTTTGFTKVMSRLAKTAESKGIDL